MGEADLGFGLPALDGEAGGLGFSFSFPLIDADSSGLVPVPAPMTFRPLDPAALVPANPLLGSATTVDLVGPPLLGTLNGLFAFAYPFPIAPNPKRVWEEGNARAACWVGGRNC